MDTSRTMLPDPEVRPHVSVEEAAAALGISRSSVYQAAVRGDLPAIRVGHRIVIPTARLREMLGLSPRVA